MGTIKLNEMTTNQEVDQRIALIHQIWQEHFIPIIGKQQVLYMLENYQSPEIIKEQIQAGNYHYFILESRGESVGYLAYYLEKDGLFLSKLYLSKESRGQGIASSAMKKIEAIARENQVGKIRLQCNRDNQTTLEIYRHFGFEIVEERVTDIGSGFVMDDYFMEKKL